jgi:mono/diheme cytochrome c family protein
MFLLYDLFYVYMASRDGVTKSSSQRICLCLGALLLLAGCHVERRKSDAELGLNPQQATGRRLYDQYCDRCHEPYSSRDKNGPGLEGLFKKQYMRASGLPANDARAGEIILYGRGNMPSFGQTLNQQQMADLMAYLHTL